MKKFMSVVALAAALVIPAASSAEEFNKADDWVWSPVGFGLAAPVQIPWTTSSIKGFRFTGFYGMNDNVSGMSLGLANSESGDMRGFDLGGINCAFDTSVGCQMGVVNYANSFMGAQFGVLNWVNTDTYGFQLGALNCDQGPFTGIDIAAINHAISFKGVQVGVLNFAYEADGLQLGVINACDYMHGVQIGVLNLICESQLPIMVIGNASF